MDKILDKLRCHDPACKVRASDVRAAHTKAGIVSPAKAAYLLNAREFLLLHVAEPSDLLLDLACAELLKAGWTP